MTRTVFEKSDGLTYWNRPILLKFITVYYHFGRT